MLSHYKAIRVASYTLLCSAVCSCSSSDNTPPGVTSENRTFALDQTRWLLVSGIDSNANVITYPIFDEQIGYTLSFSSISNYAHSFQCTLEFQGEYVFTDSLLVINSVRPIVNDCAPDEQFLIFDEIEPDSPMLVYYLFRDGNFNIDITESRLLLNSTDGSQLEYLRL